MFPYNVTTWDWNARCSSLSISKKNCNNVVLNNVRLLQDLMVVWWVLFQKSGEGGNFFFGNKVKEVASGKKLTACSIQVQINLRHGWESKDLVKLVMDWLRVWQKRITFSSRVKQGLLRSSGGMSLTTPTQPYSYKSPSSDVLHNPSGWICWIRIMEQKCFKFHC